MRSDLVNDATFWPALPCGECHSDDVPFCLDAGGDAIGACEKHVAFLLKRVLFEQRGDCLVIRNEPVLPLPSEADGAPSP